MKKKDFVELVKKAKKSSDEFYKTGDKKSPNPYYIGFGNPDSEILILGKEKGFDFKNRKKQAFFESINNPTEWLYHIENETVYTKKNIVK